MISKNSCTPLPPISKILPILNVHFGWVHVEHILTIISMPPTPSLSDRRMTSENATFLGIDVVGQISTSLTLVALDVY